MIQTTSDDNDNIHQKQTWSLLLHWHSRNLPLKLSFKTSSSALPVCLHVLHIVYAPKPAKAVSKDLPVWVSTGTVVGCPGKLQGCPSRSLCFLLQFLSYFKQHWDVSTMRVKVYSIVQSIGLNAVRALSIASLIWVILSTIVDMNTNVKAMNAFGRHQDEFSLVDCEYIELSVFLSYYVLLLTFFF